MKLKILSLGTLALMLLLTQNFAFAQPADEEEDAQLGAAKAAAAGMKAANDAQEVAKKKAKEEAAAKAKKEAEEKAAAEAALPSWGDEPAAAAPNDGALPAWGDEPANLPSWDDSGAGADLTADWDTAFGFPAASLYPWFEFHGYYRLRLDFFHGMDLNTYRADTGNTSPILPPLAERESDGFGDGSETLAGGNMRLRLRPSIHVSENLRVHTSLDVFDNLVLGSTPRNAATPSDSQIPLDDFRGAAAPQEAGRNGYQDALRFKRLWGEWRTPLNATIAFGRMPNHFGLGLLNHSGDDLDNDFGDSVDRLMGVTHLFDTYLSFSWDFADEGAVGYSGMWDRGNQVEGQAYDLDQTDDITRYTIGIFNKPMSRKEKAARAELLRKGEMAFDWGFQTTFHSRDNDTELPQGDMAADETGYQLRRVRSDVVIPDLWLSLEYQPKATKRYSLQLEVVGIFGEIAELPQRAGEEASRCLDPTIINIDDCPSSQIVHPRERDIQQWGYALEFDVQDKSFRWGLHHGVASGDSQEGFGVLDQTPLDSVNLRDDAFTNFTYNRAYTVDLILFREMIGAVTNAMWFKPYLGYDFVSEVDEAWGFTLSAIYARALEKEATPGDDANLGLELDLEVFIHEFDRFKWSAAYGIFVPMGAFDLRDPQNNSLRAEPEIAQTIQAFIGVEF